MGQIIIEDYLESFEVKSKSGDVIGIVRFNPADNGILDRYEDAVKKMQAIAILPGESEIDFAKRVEQEIKDMIDGILNQQCSDVFFSVATPLTVLASGNLYCESVLDGIASAIGSATTARFKHIKAKVNKYAAKYHN